MAQDPHHQYFSDCKRAIEPALDLLGRVKDQLLDLEEYTLQNGCCSGFMKACELVPEMMNRVIVDNCSF